MPAISAFTAKTLPAMCDDLAQRDPGLATIMTRFGYPPFWSRPNTYETMVHFILEQQVSLASALAALNAIRATVGTITPHAILALDDRELRSAYVSRQKSAYLRALASAILAGELDLPACVSMSDDDIHQQLIRHKGIGPWTVDVYLIMVLHRPDVFPIGDIAILNGFRRLKDHPSATKEDILRQAEAWRPNRAIAAMLLWHYYLSSKQRAPIRRQGPAIVPT